MALDYRNRAKSTPQPQLDSRSLAQRWGSAEQVAAAAVGSASATRTPRASAMVTACSLGLVAVAAAALAAISLSDWHTASSPAGSAGSGRQDPLHSALLGSADDASTGPLSLGTVIRRTEDSVVKINILTPHGQPQSFGSGFVIDGRGWIATNHHVVQTAARAQIEYRDGRTAEVLGIVAADEGADLAIIAVPARAGMQVLEFNAQIPKEGDDIFAIGHPQGLAFSVTTGVVGAVRKTADFPAHLSPPGSMARDTLFVQSNAAISGGSSGGPLCDSQGRVVGVSSWLAVRENFAFAVHVGHLQKLLKNPPPQLALLPGARPVDELESPLAVLSPRIQQMVQEFRSADLEFQRTVQGAATVQARDKLLKDQPHRGVYAERLWQIAESERKTAAALQALILVAQLYLPGLEDKSLRRALDRLSEDHLAARGMHQLAPALSTHQHAASTGLLKALLERNPHAQVKGAACYFYAHSLLAQGKPEQRVEVLRLLERCRGEFQDVAIDVGSQRSLSLGTLAEQDAFRVRHLTVGSPALGSEIQALHGQRFRLDDYRGQVVLLDFFADWCPHCVAMYPYERKLVEQYAGKPFALLGINGDGPDTLKQLIDSKTVTWKCWSDGQNGAIQRVWQVTALPTMFLLDGQGIIRQIYVGRAPEKKLDEDIRALMAEAEKSSPSKEKKRP